MLTDEQLIEQIRSGLHAELAHLDPSSGFLERLPEPATRHRRGSRLWAALSVAAGGGHRRLNAGSVMATFSVLVSIAVAVVAVTALGHAQHSRRSTASSGHVHQALPGASPLADCVDNGRLPRYFSRAQMACQKGVGESLQKLSAITVNSNVLTVSSTSHTVLSAAQGKEVQASCSFPASQPSLGGPEYSVQIGSKARWPKDAESVSIALPGSLPAGASRCALVTSPVRPQSLLLAQDDLTVPAQSAPLQARKSAAAVGVPDTTLTLTGRQLTVRSANPALLHLARGTNVIGLCRAGWTIGGSLNGSYDMVNVGSTARWSSGADTVTVTLPADISTEVGACQLQTNGIAAEAAFTASAQTLLRRVESGYASDADTQLTAAYNDAKAAQATSATILSSTALIDDLKHKVAAQYVRVQYAQTLENVYGTDVLYVVASGTRDARIELASRDPGGFVHVLTATAGGRATLS